MFWPVAAVAAVVLVAIVDAALGSEVILTGGFTVPVLALALVARPREVAGAAILATVLALLSGVWDDYLFSPDHVVRLTVVAVGGFLAVASARARVSGDEERRRMAVLADVARITDAPAVPEA